MKKNRRWMAAVTAGFLAVYLAAMGLSVWLMGLRYKEQFQSAYLAKQSEAYRLAETLETELEGETDEGFRAGYCRYLLGTMLHSGSPWQQYGAAVYDGSGRRIAEAGSGISILYGYPRGEYGQPFTWPLGDYLTEEESKELAKYVALQYRNAGRRARSAWSHKAPSRMQEYRFSLFLSSETLSPSRIVVQDIRWERDGTPAPDALTGMEINSCSLSEYPEATYYQTGGEIVWQWGESEAAKGTGTMRMTLDTGNMFPYIGGGAAAWKSWEENRYLHEFPETLSKIPLETYLEEAGKNGVGNDRKKQTVPPALEEGENGYSILLLADGHPWRAAWSQMKYICLACFLLMAVCLWAIIRMTDRVYRQQAALEENRRDFTNAMAHELKTPLGIIRGFAENLLGGVCEEKKEYYLRQIIGQTEVMDELAAEMIDISRMDCEQAVRKEEEIALGGLIREELERSRVLLSEKGLEVHEETDREWVIPGDRARLEKAVRNLITNAVCYNREGGAVWITVRPGCCVIENTAAPLSKEQIEHAFDMFYRGDAGRSGGHMGLGLYLARKILNLHDLSLEIGNTKRGVGVTIRNRRGR